MAIVPASDLNSPRENKFVLKIWFIGCSVYIIILVYINYVTFHNFSPTYTTQADFYEVRDNSFIDILTNWAARNMTEEDGSAINYTFEKALLRKKISYENARQFIYNREKFGQSIDKNTAIIVVQIDNSLEKLKRLVENLKQVKHINGSLLIFSQRGYDISIYNYVKNQNFCRIMHIFFPYNLQIYDDRFPGKGKLDCPEDISVEEAEVLNCMEVVHYDCNRHYRNAKRNQDKHHWWWTVNTVFDHLYVTQNFMGLFLFLEENYYVTPDAIHVLKLIERGHRHLCAICNIFTLGRIEKGMKCSSVNSASAKFSMWSASYNIGLAFNRTTWRKIKECAEFFCLYDEYRWDLTLQHVSLSCMSNQLLVVTAICPKVLDPSVKSQLNAYGSNTAKLINDGNHEGFMLQNQDKLFPIQLQVRSRVFGTPKLPKSCGWADFRDHALCLSFSNDTIKSS